MTDQHIASAFDRDLEGIQARIMKMGGLVEAAIRDAATSLETRDEELALRIRRGDKTIDEMEDLINEEAARVIALRAPAGPHTQVDPLVPARVEREVAVVTEPPRAEKPEAPAATAARPELEDDREDEDNWEDEDEREAEPDRASARPAPRSKRTSRPTAKVTARARRTSNGRVSIQAWTTAGEPVTARVWISGERQSGTTPMTVDLAPGNYELHIESDTHPAYDQRIEVAADGTTEVYAVVDLES